VSKLFCFVADVSAANMPGTGIDGDKQHRQLKIEE